MEGNRQSHGLSQRLVQLENCAAKLAETKANLRDNVEKVNKEIGQVMSTEMNMLRIREQQLLSELSRLQQTKEAILNEKQQQVQKIIGACQQALASPYPRSHVSYDLNTSIDEDVRVEFEADIAASKQHIGTFGKLKHGRKCTRENLRNVGRSLPLELESYEDNMWLLSKKSTPYPASGTPETPHEVDTVKGWLSRLPIDQSALNFDLSQFAVVSDPMSSDDSVDVSETASSFEVISDKKVSAPVDPLPENNSLVLSQQFIQSLRRPMHDWLMGVSQKSRSTNELPPAPVPAHFLQSTSQNTTKEAHTFGDVIRKVHDSDNAQWIQNSGDETEIESSMSTSTTVIVSGQNADEERMDTEEIGFNEEKFVENLTNLFGRTLRQVTSSEAPLKDCQLDDISVWREIMRQMHSSKTWLHQ